LKRIFILFLSLLAFVHANAQPELPDLLAALKKTDDTSKVLTYGHLSSAYRYKNQDSAFYYADKGFELAVKLKYHNGIARILRLKGTLYDLHGNLDSAVIYFHEALYVFQSINNNEGVATVLNNLGVAEGQRGNYDLATRYFLRALRIFNAINNKKGIIETNMKLALASDLSGNVQRAISYNETALKLLGPDTVSVIGQNVLNNMGTLHGKRKDFATALGYLERGMAISEKIPYSSATTALRTNAGNVYSHMGDKKRALECYTQSLQDAVQYKLPVEQTHALINLASLQDSSHANTALFYLEQALAIVKEIKHDDLLSDVYHSISQVYAVAGRYEDAYKAAVNYHALVDTQTAVSRSKEIAELQANYDLEESKGRIQALELDNQKKTFERNLLITAAVSIVIIIVILCIYFVRVRNLNKKLEKSNRVKDQLFSVIGHDLRAPVGGIVQTLELMQKVDMSKEEIMEMIVELHSRGEMAEDILNAMLLWGKAQLQGAEVTPVKFDPQPYIQKTINTLSKQAKDKGITINNTVAGDMTLYADADHFEMAIRNLLSNAIKFSHTLGTIDIDAKAEAHAIVFSVTDKGVGISKEAQHIFKQSNLPVTYGTKGEKGTGLGLRLVKDYIHANKGDIWLQSEKGEGSTFYLKLKGHIGN
jgi:Signal transduction histidine kinase